MKRHQGKTIWFTGLSASGKSAISSRLEIILQSRGVPVVLLDGDILRTGLNRDLGFSAADRAENIRRAGETAKILAGAGHTVIAAFITPLESIRTVLRSIFDPKGYVEIYLDCPLSVCEERDPKGLYRRARRGEILEFTGLTSPFEPAANAELIVPTGEQTLEESIGHILTFLETRFPDLTVPVTHSRPVRTREPKVAVIGLDSVPPSLVFGEAGNRLYNLRALMEHGSWGPLRSTDPPITIPAWATMTTGRDPGELGLYGFRNRLSHDYREMTIADASHVEVPRVWDYLDAAGHTSILIGVPQTYPPKPHSGITVCGPFVPDNCTKFTYPEGLANELPLLSSGDYLSDVKDFRKSDRTRLLEDLHTMVDGRFRLARELIARKPWNFFMMVEMAPDRLHHAFWRYANQDHRLYEPGNSFEHVIRDFYTYLDSCIGSLLALLSDDTTVMVVSDHGVRSMVGAVAINEWLIRNNYLVLRETPDSERPLTPDIVDWSKTVAWSEGGYYARIFLNVKGREPQGTIEPARFETVRDELALRLGRISDHNGDSIDNVVLKPDKIYRACRRVPPDLMVYFDGLKRRSVGNVGSGKVFRKGNDTGPDDANHDIEGIVIKTKLSDVRSGVRIGAHLENATCLDITPTILNEFDVPIPADMAGKIIGREQGSPSDPSSPEIGPATPSPRASELVVENSGYSLEEQEIIKKRLESLGYI
jgi:adenylyl-sulfate kinase